MKSLNDNISFTVSLSIGATTSFSSKQLTILEEISTAFSDETTITNPRKPFSPKYVEPITSALFVNDDHRLLK